MIEYNLSKRNTIRISALGIAFVVALLSSNLAHSKEVSWSNRPILRINTVQHIADISRAGINADGSHRRNLTKSDTKESKPAYSPDGKTLVYTSENDGRMQVHLMDADGRNQQNLTRSSSKDGSASFSPDGKQIVFASDRSGWMEV